MPINIKTKMSTSAYVLLAILIVAIIALPILHLVGVIDLSFMVDAVTGIMLWSSESIINSVLLIGGVFLGGVLFYYLLKKYIIGTQIPATTAGTYIPQGQTISPAQPKEEETVVSA
jgi:hypothetical protein